VTPALLLGHPADHERAVLDLLTNQVTLDSALFFGFLARRPHRTVSLPGDDRAKQRGLLLARCRPRALPRRANRRAQW
jgi:hypothetical protein